MTPSVYPTYKALGRAIRFKGFQAQYIILAGVSLIGDLLLFIALYTCRIEPWVCITVAMGLGAGTLWLIARLSRRYGAHGLVKHLARRHIPKQLCCKSRNIFLDLLKKPYVHPTPSTTSDTRDR